MPSRLIILVALAATACTTTTRMAAVPDARLRTGGQRHGFVLESHGETARIDPNTQIRFHSRYSGWTAWHEGRGLSVDDRGVFVGSRSGAGWRWTDIDAVEVENFSGGKSLGALLGFTAAAAIVIPVALLLASAKTTSGGLPRDEPRASASFDARPSAAETATTLAVVVVDAATQPSPPATASWDVDATSGGTERPLFTTRARVTSMATLTGSLETTAASAPKVRDLVTSGANVRARFFDVFEVGAGLRAAYSKSPSGSWDAGAVYSLYGGLHFALDDHKRVAIPLGLDIASALNLGGTGIVEREIRVPWGLRFTNESERYFFTVQPATASYVRRSVADGGRWSIVSGLELGFRL